MCALLGIKAVIGTACPTKEEQHSNTTTSKPKTETTIEIEAPNKRTNKLNSNKEASTDTKGMSNESVAVAVDTTPEPYHWVNVFVGTLDSAFHLVEEEQFFSSAILGELLEELHIGERPAPSSIPAALALEIEASFYTVGIAKPRESEVVRPIREVVAGDAAVSVEAWSQTFVTMLTISYPSIDPLEQMMAAKVFSDLLTSLGVPRRAAFYTPDDVMRAYNAIDVEQ